MESRVFIQSAGVLIEKIKKAQQTVGQAYELRAAHDALQKEIDQLFAGLQNPTLPSAFKLRDTSLRNGYSIDNRVLNNLARFEYISG